MLLKCDASILHFAILQTRLYIFIFIGVGRFRILGGARFRILGGGGGGGQGGAKFPAGT